MPNIYHQVIAASKRQIEQKEFNRRKTQLNKELEWFAEMKPIMDRERLKEAG